MRNTKQHHNSLFVLACAGALVLGGILRLQPWLDRAASVSPAAAEATETPSALRLPERLVGVLLDFYDLVDRGQYEKAYDLALENVWQPTFGEIYVHKGLTERKEFVDALNTELEPNGLNLAIFAIRVASGGPLPIPAEPGLARTEFAVLDHLPGGLELASLYEVELEGWLGDACTPGPWRKHAVAAELSDGSWRVLLSGGPRPENKRRSEWFTDTNPFAGKSLIYEEGAQ